MAQMEPLTWEGMPRWSVEGLVYHSLGAGKQRVEPALELGSTGDDGLGPRLGATYRWARGFEVIAALERIDLGSSGTQNFVVDSTWSISYPWFGTIDYAAHQKDVVIIDHSVHSLCLGVGMLNAPPRRGRVALRGELRGGLRLQFTTATFSSYHMSYVESSSFFGWTMSTVSEEEPTEVARQNAMGLALDLGMRCRLWMGRHFSLILPDIYFSLPVLKPSFDAVYAGEVSFASHKLDLTYGTIGLGLSVHW